MKQILHSLFAAVILSLVFPSCIQTIELEEKEEKTEIPVPKLTISHTLIGSYSAKFSCSIQHVDRAFYKGGFTYGTDPALTDGKYQPGMIVDGLLTVIVTDIEPNKTYYYQAEITDDYGSVKSETKVFSSTTFKVSDADYHVDYKENVISVEAESNLGLIYTVNNAPWIIYLGDKKFRIQENTEFADRYGTVTIASADGYFTKTISIGQDQSPLHFKDEEFKKYIVGLYDSNKSGEIELEEFPLVTSIDINSGTISDMRELKYFSELSSLSYVAPGDKLGPLVDLYVFENPKLEYLTVINTAIKTVDITSLANLKYLCIPDNPYLSTIDPSHCPLLEGLDVEHCQLSSLDLSNNICLVKIKCGGNKLKTLKGINSYALRSLDCPDNNLESLDISRANSIESVNCNGNSITELDIDENPELLMLDCTGNKIADLYTRKNPKLVRLHCSDNRLESIDVSGNTALKVLDCSSNKITLLDVTRNKELECLNFKNNGVETLDVENCTKLRELYCCSSLRTLFISRTQKVAGITEGRDSDHIPESAQIRSHKDLVTIPDAEFKAYLISKYDIDKDGEISVDEGLNIKTINVLTDNVQSLEGIECFANLQYLKCSGTTDEFRHSSGRLTELDLSGNPNLYQLICDGNRISKLKLDGNRILRTLWCYNNCLTELDLSNNISLMDVNCEGNRLVALDLSSAPNLKSLDCSPMYGENGENCLKSVNIPPVSIDFINSYTYPRSVSNIPSETVINYSGKGTLNVRSFMFNYNAKEIDRNKYVIPNALGAMWPEDLTFNRTNFAVYKDHIRISAGTYYSRSFDSPSDNPFNRRGLQTLTIIAKVRGNRDNYFSLFACRRGNYNYMFREGEGGVNCFFLHDNRAYGQVPHLYVNSLPNIVSARAGTNGKVVLKSWTDNLFTNSYDIQWGDQSSGIAIFAGDSDGGEYWSGDFYWIFLSLDALTDDEIQSVINYNENL